LKQFRVVIATNDMKYHMGKSQSSETFHRWHVLSAVEVGNFVVYMDTFIVNLALPWMMSEFGVPITTIKWVVVAYLLSLTVMLLTAGRITDMIGTRKLPSLAGMALLTVGSGLCYIAPSFGALVAFRVLQGVGGALVLCNVMSSITYAFPPEKRTLAMSINAAVLALAQVTGLVIGGLLIGRFGWRPVFLLGGALSMFGLLLEITVISRPREPVEKREVSFDWPGSLLSILGIAVLFFGFERLGDDAGNSLGFWLISAGLILLILFAAVERKVRTPLLDPKLFRSRMFLFGSSAAGIYFIAAVSCYFMLPFYLQLAMGYPPLKAGMLMIPLSVGLAGTTPITTRLARKISPFYLSTAGMFLVFCSMAWFSTLTTHSHYIHAAVGLLILGIGGGLFQPPTNSSVLSAAPTGSLSAANGYLSTVRTMGQVIGAALSAQLLSRGMDATGVMDTIGKSLDVSSLGGHFPAYINAQSTAFRVAAGVALVGILVSMLRGRGNR